MQTKNKLIYFNQAQQYIMYMAVRILVVIASRRFGKSEGIIMPTLLRNVTNMPRSSGGIVSATYKQALTRTLPATLSALERLGYREYEHYYVGRKAPKNAGFKDPYIKPRNWDYFIHWFNGSVNAIVSQDIKYSSNSLTLSYIIADECKTLDYQQLTDETIPAITPLVYFKDCPWDCSRTYVSDMPTTRQGQWMLNFEKQMDAELIQLIEGLIHEIWQLKQKSTGTAWYNQKVAALEAELNDYRKEAILFAVFNVLDNLEILGERYVQDQYRELSPFKFFTAILSMKISRIEGGFYASINEKLHYYTAYNNSHLNNYRADDGSIDWKAASRETYDCRQDNDIKEDVPLCIASDTNININWLVVGQPDYIRHILRTVKSLFRKHPAMLVEVCNAFCDYYKPRRNKDVVFYFDQTFLQGKSATNPESFHETIVRILTVNGYIVYPVYIGLAMEHPQKHKEIDQAFKGSKNLFPMFNKPNNEDLLTGMEKTGTVIKPNGWGKDKSNEKEPDTEEDPCEHRTDGGDAWDTLFIGCNFFPYHNFISQVSTGASFQ
jgi:hypothetical protein